MLIYKDVIKEYRTQELIKQIKELADKMSSVSSSGLYSSAAELLLRYGEFESAVTDYLSPGEDIYSGFTSDLRTAGELTGAAYSSVINNERPAVDISGCFKELFRRKFPARLHVSVPEGYAFYSLYPEMYIDAALRFVSEYQSGNAVVIGIRGIGCSLASVVSAVLRQNSWSVRSFTVRPRGEYFSRRVCISEKLKHELFKVPGAKYLITDEGPGLSGSSFCSAAEYLSLNGIPDDDIFFFPSWDADGSTFVSAEPRIRWQRHKKIYVSFEESIIESGRLKKAFGYDSLQDISAGKWRNLFYENYKSNPHTFAGAEQRKYLISRRGEKSILKFSGTGHYGLKLFERAKILYEAGFSPKAEKMDYGFIELEFLKGKQLEAKQKSDKFIDRLAEYISFTGRTFPEAPAMNTDQLKEMIRINVEKGLGEKWALMLKENVFLRESDYIERPAAIDGRMLPFEWISVNGVYMKTDSLQHHVSHFIPGSADIAWDLAGAIIEFRIGGNQYGIQLTSTYAELSGDRNITRRLPFYLAAYAAFRLGYTEFAAQRSGDLQEKRKLQYQSNYYKSILREILSRP